MRRNKITKLIDILILCKNNQSELNRTLKSIPYSTNKLKVKINIFDGSEKNLNIYKYKKDFFEKDIQISYWNTQKLNIEGIYPSMNYALTKVSGDWFIFMNSGDEFYKESIFEDLEKYFFMTHEVKLLFGRANIIGKRSWIMPHKKVNSIRTWLRFFKPNHQSIFLSSSISHEAFFNIHSPANADQEWKCYLLKKYGYKFIPQNICKFYLGGISSRYSLKLLKLKLREKKRSSISKFFETLKFILFKLNFDVELLQYLKNYFFSLFI